jgi:hypothetical protein
MVKLFKLVSGEEVVASYEITSEGIVMTNPVMINLTAKGLAMMPLCPIMKGNRLVIDPSKVVYDTELDDEIANGYNSKFGGVLLATGLSLG